MTCYGYKAAGYIHQGCPHRKKEGDAASAAPQHVGGHRGAREMNQRPDKEEARRRQRKENRQDILSEHTRSKARSAPTRDRLQHMGSRSGLGTGVYGTTCGKMQERSDTPAPGGCIQDRRRNGVRVEVVGALHSERVFQLPNITILDEPLIPRPDGEGEEREGSKQKNGSGRAHSAPCQSDDEIRTAPQ